MSYKKTEKSVDRFHGRCVSGNVVNVNVSVKANVFSIVNVNVNVKVNVIVNVNVNVNR